MQTENAGPGTRQHHLNLSQRRWFFIPLIIAALLVALSMLLVPGIEHSDQTSTALPVNVQKLTPTSITPLLRGFGEVRSRHTWQALTQVGGKVAWQHENLHNGAQFAPGTLLLTIDPVDYEAASAQADAQMRSARANLAEVRQRKIELDKAIGIERRAYELAQQRYTRNQQLAEKGHISRLQLEAEERDLLRQQQTLQNLETEKSLQPDRLEAAQSNITRALAQQNKASADLERTKYYMPFRGRISNVQTETGQFVPSGRSMFTAESIEAVEVLMEVPYAQLLARFPAALAAPVNAAAATPLVASLTYETGHARQRYAGSVNRINPGLNNSNRAVALYIDLDTAENPNLPPLNQYLDVTVRGTPLQDVFVIPRTAVHNGQVWIMDAENTLQAQKVDVLYTQDDLAVLSAASNPDLATGTNLVTSSLLFPAIGMPLEPVVQ